MKGLQVSTMKFIDLFHGLGGFHVALSQLGLECVFASDIDQDLRKIYEQNFGIVSHGDIKKVAADQIPEHDVLCAGFPCQPWSKAGKQQGFAYPDSGDLFVEDVLRIISHHRQQYIILENVPNLERHDEGRTWQRMERELCQLGYDVKHKRLSPHRYGIPHNRERMFIVASRSPLPKDVLCIPEQPAVTIHSILVKNPADARPIPPQISECIQVWQEFLDTFPTELALPGFPIWSMEFGATYPYKDTTPIALGPDALKIYKGSHGVELKDFATDDVMKHLPSYAKTVGPDNKYPAWKIGYIRQNRELYQAHKIWIDEWLPLILSFPPSQQKLEWNAGKSERDILKLIIQVRASGLRVKRATTAPSLVAMTTTHVPIIGWEGRYITPTECARLQSLGELKHLPSVPTRVYTALGNAVNAHVVKLIAEALFSARPLAAAQNPVLVDETLTFPDLFSDPATPHELVAA